MPSRGRLAEKIRLFDRGLDDRVVELCKAVLLCQQSQLTAEELFYQPLEDGSDGIVFTGRPPAAYPLTKALRQAVETRFAPLLARPEEETFAAIDAAWALEQLAAQS